MNGQTAQSEHAPFAMVSNEVIQDSKLKDIDLKVYVSLCSHADNKTGEMLARDSHNLQRSALFKAGCSSKPNEAGEGRTYSGGFQA